MSNGRDGLKFGAWLVQGVVALLAAVGIGVALRVAHIPGLSTPRPSTPGSGLASAGDWPIEKPPVSTPLGTAAEIDALPAALEPYRREDFAAATAALEGYTATHPQSSDGWFYLGASQLLSGDAARSRPSFDKARVLSAGKNHPDLEWLAATAEARTGAIDSARSKLEALCATPSQLQVRACAAKESLKR